MSRSLRILSAVLAGACFALCMPDGAAAACTSTDGTYFYRGRLDDGRLFGATLSMALVDAAGRAHRVRGRLYVGPGYADEAVDGEIVDGESLTLRDERTGRTRIAGGFVDLFHRMSTDANTCDGIAVRVDDRVGGLLRLDFWLPSGGTDIHAGRRAAMNAVAPDVVDAIERGDAARVATHVAFPLVVVFPDRPARRVTIPDAQTFVRLGPRLIGPRVRCAVAGDVPHDLFCRGDGCMLGNGAVWFDESNRIVGLWPG